MGKGQDMMRCAICGERLDEDAPICSRCGATVASGLRGGAAAGLPTMRLAPSPAGPPVARDVIISAPPRPVDPPPVQRSRGYRPVVLEPKLRRRRSRGKSLPLAGLALLAVIGLAAGLVARLGGVPLPGFGTTAARQPTPTASAVPACLPATITAPAPHALAHLQLATHVRDLAKHDFQPVDSVTTVHAGQLIYATFEIATTSAGTAGLSLCTPGQRATGTLEVPTRASGRYAQFTLHFSSADIGQGVVTLTWNGAVTASLPFTIAR
jgi:hypothetical protein